MLPTLHRERMMYAESSPALRLGRCLLAPSSGQLLISLCVLFLFSLLRENRFWDWLKLAAIAVQADLLYVACFLFTFFCIYGWFAGILTARNCGCESRAGLAFTGFTFATFGWFSLVRIAELHDLQLICRSPCTDLEIQGPRGITCCWFCLPVGVFGTFGGAVLRPFWCLAAVPTLSSSSVVQCARSAERPWWEWRELLVGTVFWIRACSIVLTANASERRRHSHELVLSSLVLLASLILTAEPVAWFWSFLAKPIHKLWLQPRLGLAPTAEERLVLVICCWLLLRRLYLGVSITWERRRTWRKTEEHLQRAIAHPFRASLEEGFGAQAGSRCPGLDPAISVDCLSSDGLSRLQAKQRALMTARRQQLRRQVAGEALLPSRLALSVRRSHLLADSLAALAELPPTELLAPAMSVDFEGEQGIDAGGLSKDWFDSMARALAEGASRGGPLRAGPDGALAPGPAAGYCKHDSLAGLRAVLATGRFLALAVLREQPLPMLLSLLTCKLLLRLPLGTEDVRQLDPQFFRHRVECVMRAGGVAALEAALGGPATFVAAPHGRAAAPEELLPGGAQRHVTEENKAEYVRRLCESHLCGGARREISCLLDGFWDILPLELLRAYEVSVQELSALVSGSCSLDPEEWRRHSHSCGGADAQITEWFWEAVGEITPAQRCLLLRFVTGSSRPPPGGFVDMQPPFCIEISSFGSPHHLPQAHTCTNTIVLYHYTSKAQLFEKLLMALSTEGFALA